MHFVLQRSLVAQHYKSLNIPRSRMSNQAANFQNYTAHQRSLPRLPIPSLEHLASTYLKSIAPLCQNQPEKLALAEKNLQEFISGPGIILQQKLIEYDKTQPVNLTFLPHYFL